MKTEPWMYDPIWKRLTDRMMSWAMSDNKFKQFAKSIDPAEVPFDDDDDEEA